MCIYSEKGNGKTHSDKIVRCIGTFDGNNKQVKGILQQYWPILLADNDVKEVLSNYYI